MSGKESQESGKLTESLVIKMGESYEQHGILRLVKNHPETLVYFDKRLRRKVAKIIGPAQADFHATLALHGGRSCWIETKTLEGKERHTYSFTTTNLKAQESYAQRRDQLLKLEDEQAVGALAFYLARWHYKDMPEAWVLHPIDTLERIESKLKGLEGIVFCRGAGLYVPTVDGLPDFYQAVKFYIEGIENHGKNQS